MPISSVCVYVCVPALVCVLSGCVYFLQYVKVTSSYFSSFFPIRQAILIYTSAVRVARFAVLSILVFIWNGLAQSK